MSVLLRGSGARVLLVEDNVADARLVRIGLTEAVGDAVHVDHAETLSDAITSLQTSRYDAILLDLGLPDAQGLEALARIKPFAPQVPIVVLTGMHDDERAAAALEQGAQDYLIKGRVDGELTARAIRYARSRQQILLELERTSKTQLQMKDRFLSTVSHELRSPLTAIHQFVTILLDGLAGPVAGDQREHLETILRNVNQLRRMIGDLLSIGRIQGGAFRLDLVEVDVTDLVRDVMTSFDLAVAEKGVRIVFETPADDGRVPAAPERIREVLTNLIDNAIKFSDERGTVTIRTYRDDTASLVVAVRDTGCGVSPEAQAHIFEGFYQGNDSPSRSRNGLGLGLFVVKELVEAHGGRVWFKSVPGGETEFLFTIPSVLNPPRDQLVDARASTKADARQGG